MQERQFGAIGEVSRLTLGGGGIGQVWGETSRHEGIATLRGFDGGRRGTDSHLVRRKIPNLDVSHADRSTLRAGQVEEREALGREQRAHLHVVELTTEREVRTALVQIATAKNHQRTSVATTGPPPSGCRVQ